MSTALPVLELKKICCRYEQGTEVIDVLKDFDMSVYRSEMVALTGPSGCGKSSLLHIAGLLDKATSGDVYINSCNCSIISEKERTKHRLHSIGFVYQQHHLLQNFSALENVLMPMKIAKTDKLQAHKRALKLLDALKLSHRIKHWPSQLSGGEQQRVAIARALANSPSLVIADEPTGNLDPETSQNVFQLFTELVKEDTMAVLVATHNVEMAQRMSRVVHLTSERIDHESNQN